MMPRRIRRRKRTRKDTALDRDQLEYLISGCSYKVPVFTQPDWVEPMWKAHREEILEAFIAKYPGRRPWAWWKFDQPEGRRLCLTDPEFVHDSPGGWEGKFDPFCFGVPSSISSEYQTHLEWEPQADYLARNDLFTATESKVFKNGILETATRDIWASNVELFSELADEDVKV